MNNPNAIIKKLLFVLNRLGEDYKMMTTQYYNEDKDKMISKYTIYSIHPKSDGEDFYSSIEVILYLAKEYERYKKLKEGGGSG